MQKTDRVLLFRRALRSAGSLLLLLAATVSLGATSSARASEDAGHEVKARYDDWAVICKKADRNDCRATYSVVDKESQTLVVHWAVARRDSDGKHTVRIRLPLGIWMAEGISLRIGDNRVDGIAITNCDLLGCYVNAILDEPITTSMLTEEEGALIFRGPDRTEVTTPASMKGFARAAASLTASR